MYDEETQTYTETPPVAPANLGAGIESLSADLNRRLAGGNIYGGCYTSGVVDGNVVININATIMERDKLFDEVQSDELGEEVSLYGHDQTTQTAYTITKRHTGVILGQQGMDVFGKSLNVFGGGKGKDTEIWGSTTINLNKGYTFQVFGGSEEGVIGRSVSSDGTYEFNGKHYKYDPQYSCYVNLKGKNDGVSKKADSSEDMAECEFMYGGGFFGPIAGNTVINLGKGRIFNSFAGSCNADILGHTETYIGRMVKDEYQDVMGDHVAEEDAYVSGFPWIRDIVYGGNDLGGEIQGEKDFTSRVRTDDADFDVLGKVYKYDATDNPAPDVLKAEAYVEYLQGRADGIFGGCYGTYNYKDEKYRAYFDANGDGINGFKKPHLSNAFVNFRPTYTNTNTSSTSFSLNTSIPLFTGFQIPNTIQLSKLNLEAATQDLEKAKNDIRTQVAQAYVQILYDKEIMEVANRQIAIDSQQVHRLQVMLDNGKASPAELSQQQATPCMPA